MHPALYLPGTGDASSRYRFGIGLALSVFVHLSLVAAVRPMTATVNPFVPFQVELRQAAAEERAALAGESPSDTVVETAALRSAPGTPRPESAPSPGAVARAPEEVALPIDRYYSTQEVDVRAEPVNDVDLVYPQRAYQNRTRGRVLLRMLISERGVVDEVSVVSAEPPGVFDDAALTAARAQQFSPALRHGRRVKSQKTVEVVFDPYERIHLP
jgi:protein TonB